MALHIGLEFLKEKAVKGYELLDNRC